MKRNYGVVCLLLSVTSVFGQGIEIGEKVPAFQVEMVNADQSFFSFDASNGKAVLIDFWATWCSPCISGMPHLEELQKRFEVRLQVVAASEEKLERLIRFREKKPFEFLFAKDTGTLRALFPYQVIPHSILISPEGNLVAITSPENITEEVITQVLAGKSINLPIKKDHFSFNPELEYFDFAEDVKQIFQLQPYMSGFPTFSRTFTEGPYKHRRITIFNFTIAGLYKYAYQISEYRLIYEFDQTLIDWKDKNNRYCLNVIATDPAKLYPFMKQQLSLNTEVLAKQAQRELEVLVVNTAEGGVKAKKGKEVGILKARGDKFQKKGATIAEFCDYLEEYGIVGMAVVDETGDKGLYEIDFSFSPENPQSFKEAMTDLGLTFKKASRKTDVLVLSMK